MQTLTSEQWDQLSVEQHRRAMAGDVKALEWCAKHAPGNGAPGSVSSLLSETRRAQFEHLLAHGFDAAKALEKVFAASFCAMLTDAELHAAIDRLNARLADARLDGGKTDG